jgi:micrococcal nuclease
MAMLSSFDVTAHDQDIALTPMNVVRVYDGDTITVNLPGQLDVFGKNLGVRIGGIDTPEMVSRCATAAERQTERDKALLAKRFVEDKIASSKEIVLKNLDRDKYFRLLARVSVDGQDLSQLMIMKGLADPYDGGTKKGWCGR